MNETQRGIAAYKATAQKVSKKQKRAKKGVGPKGAPELVAADDDASVEITRRGSRVEGEPGARTESVASKGATAARRAGTNAAEPVGGANAKTATLLKKETERKGYRKVAKFLLLLGKGEAAQILKHFSKTEIEGISREIAEIRKIDDAEAAQLLAEFGVADGKIRGRKAGPETARSMLTAAFGETRARQILGHAVPETREKPFQFLADLDPEQVILLLKNESVPTISIVMPHLPPRKASRVLQSMAPDLQRQAIRRIAKMRKVDPEVIVRIEGVLKERIRTQGRMITEEIDGRDALANILKYLDYAQEEKILEELSDSDPELSQDVKDRLFTIELVFDIEDADLQAILRDYDDEEIAVILKGKDERIQERMLSNLSSRRQAMVRDEILRLGKMRKSDVDSATKDFVDYLVDLDDQRKITIRRDERTVDG